MKTRCKRCRKLIDYGATYCLSCDSKIRADKKATMQNKDIEATTKSSRWKSLRAEILRRDNGCCLLCFKRGIIEYRTLQVHHIVKRVDNPELIYEPSNLVTVCRQCHEEVELLSIKEQRELFGEFNKEQTYRLL